MIHLRGYSSSRLPVVMRSVVNYTTLLSMFVSAVTGYEECMTYYPSGLACIWPTNYIRCCDSITARKYAYCGTTTNNQSPIFRRGRCPDYTICIRHPLSPAASDSCEVSPLDSNYLYLALSPPNPPPAPQPVRFFYFQGLRCSLV